MAFAGLFLVVCGMVPDSIGSAAHNAFSFSNQGFKKAEEKLSAAAQGIASGEITSSRMVELIESKHLYTANAAVVRTQDEMLGTLIDVKR